MSVDAEVLLPIEANSSSEAHITTIVKVNDSGGGDDWVTQCVYIQDFIDSDDSLKEISSQAIVSDIIEIEETPSLLSSIFIQDEFVYNDTLFVPEYLTFNFSGHYESPPSNDIIFAFPLGKYLREYDNAQPVAESVKSTNITILYVFDSATASEDIFVSADEKNAFVTDIVSSDDIISRVVSDSLVGISSNIQIQNTFLLSDLLQGTDSYNIDKYIIYTETINTEDFLRKQALANFHFIDTYTVPTELNFHFSSSPHKYVYESAHSSSSTKIIIDAPRKESDLSSASDAPIVYADVIVSDDGFCTDAVIRASLDVLNTDLDIDIDATFLTTDISSTEDTINARNLVGDECLASENLAITNEFSLDTQINISTTFAIDNDFQLLLDVHGEIQPLIYVDAEIFDQSLHDTVVARVVIDEGSGAEWAYQRWFEREFAYGNDIVSRVVTDESTTQETFSFDKDIVYVDEIDVSEITVIENTFTIEVDYQSSTTFVVDAEITVSDSCTSQEYVFFTYTVIEEGFGQDDLSTDKGMTISDSALASFSIIKNIFDTSVGDDLLSRVVSDQVITEHNINRKTVVTDQGTASFIIGRVLIDQINTDIIPVRVVFDKGYTSYNINRKGVVADQGTTSSVLRKVLIDTLYTDSIPVRVVLDDSHVHDEIARSVFVSDVNIGIDEIPIRVVQDDSSYSALIARAVLDESLASGVINRSALIRDRCRVKELPHRIVTDHCHIDSVFYPVHGVKDSCFMEDAFNVHDNLFTISDTISTDFILRKVLFEHLSLEDSFYIDISAIRVLDRARNANDRHHASTEIFIYDDCYSTDIPNRVAFIEEELVPVEHISIETSPYFVSDNRKAFIDTINAYIDVYCRDNAYAEDSVITTTNIYVYDLSTSILGYKADIYVFVEDDAPILDIVNHVSLTEKVFGSDDVVKVVFDLAYAEDNSIQSLLLYEKLNIVEKFKKLLVSAHVTDSGTADSLPIKFVLLLDNATATDEITVDSGVYVMVSDICVTWAWLAYSTKSIGTGPSAESYPVYKILHENANKNYKNYQLNVSHVATSKIDDRVVEEHTINANDKTYTETIFADNPIGYTRIFLLPDGKWTTTSSKDYKYKEGVVIGYDDSGKFGILFNGDLGWDLNFFYDDKFTYTVDGSFEEVCDNPYGSQVLNVQIALISVHDNSVSHDQVHNKIDFVEYVNYAEFLFVEVDSTVIDATKNLTDAIYVNQTISIQDNCNGVDAAEWFILVKSLVNHASVVEVQAYCVVIDNGVGVDNLYMDMGFYSGDLIISLMDGTARRKDAYLIDFLHDDKGFIKVTDTCKSFDSVSNYKFKVLPLDLLSKYGKPIAKLVLYITDIANSDDVIDSYVPEWAEPDYYRVSDKCFIHDSLFIRSTNKFVSDMAYTWEWKHRSTSSTKEPEFSREDPYNIVPRYDESGSFVKQYTYTIYKDGKYYERLFLFSPQHKHIISVNRIFSLSDVVHPPLEILRLVGPLQAIKVTDEITTNDYIVPLSNYNHIVDPMFLYEKPLETVFNSRRHITVQDNAASSDDISIKWSVHSVLDECVGIANFDFYLHPDKTIEDSTFTWGTGKEKIYCYK